MALGAIPDRRAKLYNALEMNTKAVATYTSDNEYITNQISLKLPHNTRVLKLSNFTITCNRKKIIFMLGYLL